MLRDTSSNSYFSSKRKILFFAFGEFSYIYDTEYTKGKDQVWRSLLADIHETLVDHLFIFPNDDLLYKRGPKGDRDYWSGSEELLKHSNVNLIPSDKNANELIAESDVILAFQTTAVFDAMHTNKIIIYCAWGENYQDLKSGLIDFEGYACEGAILHAHSPEELKYFLSLNLRNIIIDVQARKRIRESFTSNPDGRVANRFASCLQDILYSNNKGDI